MTQMTKNEISVLLANKTADVISIEHQHKTDLQKKTLDQFMRDARSALLQHKNINLILLKE